MKRVLWVFVTVGIVVFGCNNKDHSRLEDEISGTYVREYTFKVVQPETGADVGMRIIRDTIFVRAIDGKYQISNHKWSMNDYDIAGWKNMEHAEDRPMLPHQAVFNALDSALISDSELPLYLNLRSRDLSRGKRLVNSYRKVH